MKLKIIKNWGLVLGPTIVQSVIDIKISILYYVQINL